MPRDDYESYGVQGVNLGSEYTAEEVEFMMAVQAYKEKHRRKFPTCRDFLKVIKSLGYRRESTNPP